MYKTIDEHIKHEALNILTQFRAGINTVHVLKKTSKGRAVRQVIDAEDVFNEARKLQGDSDEDNIITVIEEALKLTGEADTSIQELEVL